MSQLEVTGPEVELLCCRVGAGELYFPLSEFAFAPAMRWRKGRGVITTVRFPQESAPVLGRFYPTGYRTVSSDALSLWAGLVKPPFEVYYPNTPNGEKDLALRRDTDDRFRYAQVCYRLFYDTDAPVPGLIYPNGWDNRQDFPPDPEFSKIPASSEGQAAFKKSFTKPCRDLEQVFSDVGCLYIWPSHAGIGTELSEGVENAVRLAQDGGFYESERDSLLQAKHAQIPMLEALDRFWVQIVPEGEMMYFMVNRAAILSDMPELSSRFDL